MYCPNCGGTHVETIQVQNTHHQENTVVNAKVKGFGFCKACVGTVILGPIGILCGLCGMGKGKTRTTVTNHVTVEQDSKCCCLDCGHQFYP